RSNILHHCVDNIAKGIVYERFRSKVPLQHRQGVQWTFCGHAAHYSCLKQYINNNSTINEDITASDFFCPTCKVSRFRTLDNTLAYEQIPQTVSNFLLPLMKVHQDPLIVKKRFDICGEQGLLIPEANYFSKFQSLHSKDQSEIDDFDAASSFEEFLSLLSLSLPAYSMYDIRNNEIVEFLLDMEERKAENDKKAKSTFLSKLLHISEATEKILTNSSIDDAYPSLLCDILSYSTSCLEARFRIYQQKEIQEQLPVQLQANHTAVASVWRLFTTHILGEKIGAESPMFSDKGMSLLEQSSWKHLADIFSPCPSTSNSQNEL
ncbi:hypothetical protein RFI_10531, partial [Reticulomyxa filosa]